MEKKKKRLIILSVVAGALVLLMLLSSAVFKIRGVSVEYQTTLTLLTKDDLKLMVDNAEIPYGKSIFFSSLDDNIKKMEKSNPYVKVNGIERKFPNSLVVLVSERVPVVKVEYGEATYVLDNELKVLNIARSVGDFNFETGEKDLPVLKVSSSFGFSVGNVEAGDFVNNDQIKGYVDAFYRGAVAPSRENASVAVSRISTLETITINYVEELKKVEFVVAYSGIDGLTSSIIGDNNLADNVYKVMTTLNEALVSGKNYEYINCTDGVIYAKEK